MSPRRRARVSFRSRRRDLRGHAAGRSPAGLRIRRCRHAIPGRVTPRLDPVHECLFPRPADASLPRLSLHGTLASAERRARQHRVLSVARDRDAGFVPEEGRLPDRRRGVEHHPRERDRRRPRLRLLRGLDRADRGQPVAGACAARRCGHARPAAQLDREDEGPEALRLPASLRAPYPLRPPGTLQEPLPARLRRRDRARR